MVFRSILLTSTLAFVPAALLGCAQDGPSPTAATPHAASVTSTREAAPAEFTDWSAAARLESADAPADPSFNTSALDGCPFTSRDGKTFYMASNRPDGQGGLDIWVSRRASESDPWGPPVNAGVPVNSPSDDFCPTIDRDGHRFFFASKRASWGSASAPSAACGGADIYVTRFRDDGVFGDAGNPAFDEPQNVGCAPSGPNSAADEASPFPLPQSSTGPVLYFSSARPGGFIAEGSGAVTGDQDVYMSREHGGVFGPAELVPGVNSAQEDAQPNVRRDGLEIFFYSTRPTTLGGPDLYAATRSRTSDPWCQPVNLGSSVNGSAGESRPSLSWDGLTLYFGSSRTGGTAEGVSDIYVTTRQGLASPGC